MPKYFYTCPIEASYMEKNFQMQFTTANGDRAITMMRPDEYCGRTTRYNFWFSGIGEPNWPIEDGDPIYIHPDSVELLEPKVGDEIWSVGFTKDVTVQSLDLHKKMGTKPTRRNGKLFFTPKEGE